MSYMGPCTTNARLCVTHPHGGMAREGEGRGRSPERPAIPGPFVPHFWGRKFAPPFFNFGPGGIAPCLDMAGPLLLTMHRLDR